MTEPLWTIADIAKATGGCVEGSAASAVTGISIDTRSLQPGDLFVPLSDERDGHDFVGGAFENGASAALVSREVHLTPSDATLIRVDDPLAALEDLARAARQRLRPDAVVVAVTGSVGKTGTKDMLRTCFSVFGKTHAAFKSFNNHWGVPLTLATTPKDVDAAIYELGMNHPGEITPLAKMVRPHIAIITTVEPVHLEFFESVELIAEAKAEIFDGLEAGGVAVLNADNAFFPLLKHRAASTHARILSFGHATGADVRLKSYHVEGAGGSVLAAVGEQALSYALEIPGVHVAQNSLAVIAALKASGRDVARGAEALSGLRPVAGRGAREVLAVPGGEILVIDESYNANPASMRAALGVLGDVPRDAYPRRIAILGDMLELGSDSDALHSGLNKCLETAAIDLVFLSGPHMGKLFEAVPEARRGAWAATVEGITDAVVAAVQPGDALMIKGSLGSRMAHVLAAIRDKFGG